jgi:hypothetical protein
MGVGNLRKKHHVKTKIEEKEFALGMAYWRQAFRSLRTDL